MNILSKIKIFLFYFFGTGFYTGYSPLASGTIATILTASIIYFFNFSDLIILISIHFLFVIGLISSNYLKNIHGNDPYIVTIDEVVGFLIAILFLPKTIFFIIIGFIFFRFFDIVKPPPANYFDNLKSSHGIMLDDVVAGIYTNIILQMINYFYK
ncbi:MAG: phosphatidylglycerophosphatase A [Bacteroidetes bacterium]|nr:phosphatidylglycerophosphatase A [Bacteroidota bacterium]